MIMPRTIIGCAVAITVRFFARIRESLGTDVLQLAPAGECGTAAAVANLLAARHGALWQEMLLAPNTLVAVNGQTVPASHPVEDGDEVAFFPPVTGG